MTAGCLTFSPCFPFVSFMLLLSWRSSTWVQLVSLYLQLLQNREMCSGVQWVLACFSAMKFLWNSYARSHDLTQYNIFGMCFQVNKERHCLSLAIFRFQLLNLTEFISDTHGSHLSMLPLWVSCSNFWFFFFISPVAFSWHFSSLRDPVHVTYSPIQCFLHPIHSASQREQKGKHKCHFQATGISNGCYCLRMFDFARHYKCIFQLRQNHLHMQKVPIFAGTDMTRTVSHLLWLHFRWETFCIKE